MGQVSFRAFRSFCVPFHFILETENNLHFNFSKSEDSTKVEDGDSDMSSLSNMDDYSPTTNHQRR